MDLKLYFCESCGKRLTSIDLEEGQAKDKKLKGVYCKSCSVGVMTMDMVAVREKDVRTPSSPRKTPLGPALAEVSPPRQPQTKVTSARRAPEHGTPPTERRKAASNHSVVLIGGAAALIVAVSMVIALTGRAPQQVAAAPEPPHKIVSKPAPPALIPVPAHAPEPAVRAELPANPTLATPIENPLPVATSPANLDKPPLDATPLPAVAPNVDTTPPVTAICPPLSAQPPGAEYPLTQPPVLEKCYSPEPTPQPATPAPPPPPPPALTTNARIKQAISGEILKSTGDLYVEVRYDFVKNPKSVGDFEGPIIIQADGAKVKAAINFDKEFGNSDVFRYSPVFQPRALQIEYVVSTGQHDVEVVRMGNAHLSLRWVDTGQLHCSYGPRFAADVFKGRKWKHPALSGTYRYVFERVPGKLRFLIDDKELGEEKLPAESLSEKEWFSTFSSIHDFVVKEVIVKGYLDAAWLKEKTTPPPSLPPDVQPAPGLFGCYYKSEDMKDADFVLSQIDPTIKFDHQNRSPAPGVPAVKYAIRWTGFVNAEKAGQYTFSAYMNEGGRLWIDGKLLIDKWAMCNDGMHPTMPTAEIELAAGLHYIRLDYVSRIWSTVILYWKLKDGFAETVIPAGHPCECRGTNFECRMGSGEW